MFTCSCACQAEVVVSAESELQGLWVWVDFPEVGPQESGRSICVVVPNEAHDIVGVA